MKWLIIVHILGQNVALPIASEQECRDTLAKIASGEYTHITLDGGLQLPVTRGLGCETVEQFEASKGRRGV